MISFLIALIFFLIVVGAVCAVIYQIPFPPPMAPYAGLIKTLLCLLVIIVGIYALNEHGGMCGGFGRHLLS